MSPRAFTSPGPVASAFLVDRKNTVRGIMGPQASGKTNVMIMDALTQASQMPKTIDGHRRFRGLILRDNYQNLWKTTIKSWWEWFPKEKGQWSGAEGRQASHKLIFDAPDGGEIRFEMEFLALNEDRVENVLRGYEMTWGAINEADLVDAEVLTYMVGRVIQKRFPPARDLPPGASYYTGIVLDCNPPDVDNWIYRIFEEEKPSGHRLYRQPSGRSPQGENRAGVTLESYQEAARLNAHRPNWVKRMVDGQWAPSQSGQAVYAADYDDMVHCSEEPLVPRKGLPIRLGFDQGITGPAMLVGQWDAALGQLRVLREFCPGRVTASAFGRSCRAILADEFAGYRVSWATGDPAGMQGSIQGASAEESQLSWHEIVQNTMGMTIQLAPTNELEPRIDGVAQLLRHRVDAGQPALLISSQCKILRKGFNSKYHFPKRKVAGDELTDKTPVKNAYSNPHDALQYLVLDLMGLDAILSGALTGVGRRGAGSGGDDDDDDDVPRSLVLNANFSVFGQGRR